MKNPDVERNNPCIKEQLITYKCFDNNNFDKTACKEEIENYKLCTEFWVSITPFITISHNNSSIKI